MIIGITAKEVANAININKYFFEVITHETFKNFYT